MAGTRLVDETAGQTGWLGIVARGSKWHAGQEVP